MEVELTSPAASRLNSVLLGKSRGRLTAYANNTVSKRADNIVLIGNNRAKVPVLAKHRLLIGADDRYQVVLSLNSDTHHTFIQ